MIASETVIEITNLTKEYEVGFVKKRKVRAIEDLSLTVAVGEIFGFLGPNGAGKTTTLKLLMRLLYPTSGTIRILGDSIDDLTTRSLCGYLPENPYFYDYLSGRELLEFTAALYCLSKPDARHRTAQLLDLVGIDKDRADRQLRKYSKGMLQRIGIAQALINDPQVVILDEPMSGLDPIGRREVRDLILSLREQKKTVFFSSHILTDVETLCDRAAILNRGRLVACGTVNQLSGNIEPAFEIVAYGIKESVASGLSESLKNALKITFAPNLIQILVKDESYFVETIQTIQRFDGHVISISPRRSSLEDFFQTERKETRIEG